VRHGQLLPVEGAEQMRAAWRAAGRRARRSTGQRPAIVLLCARLGSHLLASVGDVPLPTGGGPTGSTSSASVRLYGRRPSSAARPRSRDPRTGLWLRSPRRDRRAAAGDPHRASWRSGDLPASPSAPPLRCPGAVTPRAVPLAARSQPRLAPSPVAADPLASHRARLRCLGPKTSWRPACRPLATARSRRVTFHPYKGAGRCWTVSPGSGEKPGRPHLH
jgi:hypothetical protein